MQKERNKEKEQHKKKYINCRKSNFTDGEGSQKKRRENFTIIMVHGQ